MSRFNVMHQILMVLQVIVLFLVCFSACYEEGKEQPGYFFVGFVFLEVFS